jgi:putative ABC transport system ATP-binding protein
VTPRLEGGGLEVDGLHLAYTLPGGARHDVLDVPSFRLPQGAQAGIAGPSGAGKTSFLHLLAGIERPERGRIVWDGTEITALSERHCDRWRRERVGLVFQNFHLLPGLSAFGNVVLPASFDHLRVPASLATRAASLLEGLGIEPVQTVETLSRGEQQRVALARALLRRPTILLADEPTASLDAATAAEVIELLVAGATESGVTLLVASHDERILARFARRFDLVGKTLVAKTLVGHAEPRHEKRA